MPPAPKPAISNPAATLPGEADILANVLANLADHDAKLVYSDWLEERDDPRGPLLRKFVEAHRAGKRFPALSAVSKSWRELVGLTLMTKLRAAELPPLADAVLALARPALAVASVPTVEKNLPVGASKYGGQPDLPAGVRWPAFKKEPLSFFGQFNLADLHASPVARELPATGLLSVFCAYRGDGDDNFPKGSWLVFYSPDSAELRRRETGEAIAFPACRLWFAEWLTVPHEHAPQLAGLLEGVEGAADAYADLFVDIRLGDHILGHVFPMQGGGLDGPGVRHLLTIGGNDDTEWEFGDGGELYFTLPEADLKAGRFDRVAMDMDCA